MKVILFISSLWVLLLSIKLWSDNTIEFIVMLMMIITSTHSLYRLIK